MEKLTIAIGGAGAWLGSVFLCIILGPFFGGLGGWVVGLVFGDTILGIFSQLGIHNITMFQAGVFLGFVGGFLRTKTTVEQKKD